MIAKILLLLLLASDPIGSPVASDVKVPTPSDPALAEYLRRVREESR